MKLGAAVYFPAGCCKKTTPLGMNSAHHLKYSRNDPVGTRHVFDVAVSKGLQHHSFFLSNPSKKKYPKPDNSRESGRPIRQQQGLCNSPKPERGIHRVTKSSVDPVGDQLMSLAYIKAYGPISPQGTMRQPKHNQRRS